MLTIVLPVYNQYILTKHILEQLEQQICEDFSYNILLIDNNSSEVICDLPIIFNNTLDINYIKLTENIGINPAWNLAYNIIKTNAKYSNTKYILFIHNDIYINSLFLEKMVYPFEYTLESNCGIVIPNTVDNIFHVHNNFSDYSYSIVPYSSSIDHSICGWSFCIKYDEDILDAVFPLPMINKLRYGDKYIYDTILDKLNYDLIQMNTNYIYHRLHGTYNYLTDYELSKLIDDR